MGSLIRTEREKGEKVSTKSLDDTVLKKNVYNSGINIFNVQNSSCQGQVHA